MLDPSTSIIIPIDFTNTSEEEITPFATRTQIGGAKTPASLTVYR